MMVAMLLTDFYRLGFARSGDFGDDVDVGIDNDEVDISKLTWSRC